MATKRSRKAAARSLILWVVVPLLAMAGVATAAMVVLSRDTSNPVNNQAYCAARVDGVSYNFAPEQTSNAALIAAISMQRDLPARAATIALATAIQESTLRNIDYGDRDSVGLFQQRTSQGWGTIAEIMDPVYSTNKFYSVLETIPNYTTRPVTEVAQAVQLSGFPTAYADHELEGRALASALTGQSGSELTCHLAGYEAEYGPGASAGSTTGLTQRSARDFGAGMFTASVSGASVRFATGQLPAGFTPEVARTALANWAVAQSGEFGVQTVRAPGATWSRSTGAWVTSGANVTSNPPDAVVVTLAALPITAATSTG